MPSPACKKPALRGKPEAQQLELLRKQIEMRVLGCGWDKYETRWSSNKNAKIGTVEHLTTLLEEIFVDELARRHPGARVVLSTRDAGDWARSVRATIWHPQFLEKHWLFRLLLGRRAQDMCRMYRERFFGGARLGAHGYK